MQNTLVTRLAREYEIPLIDTVGTFEAASPGGLLAGDYFLDGVHFNAAGVLLLAQAFARALSETFGEPLRNQVTVSSLQDLEGKEAGEGLLSGSSWLFTVVNTDPNFTQPGYQKIGRLLVTGGWFSDVLTMAERNFKQALALDPDDFSAHLGMAIVEGTRRQGLLLDQAVRQRLQAWRVFDGAFYWVPKEDLPELMTMMRGASVDEAILREILRTHPLVDLEALGLGSR